MKDAITCIVIHRKTIIRERERESDRVGVLLNLPQIAPILKHLSTTFKQQAVQITSSFAFETPWSQTAKKRSTARSKVWAIDSGYFSPPFSPPPQYAL
jgi:hypothetical protein